MSGQARQGNPPVGDSLVLDIGGTIGALIIHAGPELAEQEIEISPEGADPSAHRTHNVVHARQLPSGVRYNAVFPSVPEGKYTVWRDATTVHGEVIVHGGQVAEYHHS